MRAPVRSAPCWQCTINGRLAGSPTIRRASRTRSSRSPQALIGTWRSFRDVPRAVSPSPSPPFKSRTVLTPRAASSCKPAPSGWALRYTPGPIRHPLLTGAPARAAGGRGRHPAGGAGAGRQGDRGISAWRAGDLDGPREPEKESAERVDLDLDAVRRDSPGPRRRFIRSDREDAPAEDRAG